MWRCRVTRRGEGHKTCYPHRCPPPCQALLTRSCGATKQSQQSNRIYPCSGKTATRKGKFYARRFLERLVGKVGKTLGEWEGGYLGIGLIFEFTHHRTAPTQMWGTRASQKADAVYTTPAGNPPMACNMYKCEVARVDHRNSEYKNIHVYIAPDPLALRRLTFRRAHKHTDVKSQRGLQTKLRP